MWHSQTTLRALCALCALSFAVPGLAQTPEFSIFLVSTGDEKIGSVVHVANQPVSAPELEGIELLDLDFSGRTPLLEFAAGRARRLDDLPEGTRLSLPAQGGSLYRYLREEPNQRFFGFFTVDALGTPRVLWERAGTGSDQEKDPFLGHVAVAPDASAVLVATTLAAGGDLIQIDVATGATTNRTANQVPLSFGPHGFFLGSDFGCAATNFGVLRFAASPAAPAAWVPLGLTSMTSAHPLRASVAGLSVGSPAASQGGPPWIAKEVVASLSGSHIAIRAGMGSMAAHVFVVSATGPAVRFSAVPDSVSPAGFAPAHDAGPFLAVSDDGTLCAWRVERPGSHELMLARAVGLPGPAAVHVTADSYYDPFLDEIGEYLFTPGNRLIALIGDRFGAAGVNRWADLYAIELGANGADPVLQNCTGSSGDLVAPFTSYGALEATELRWLPDDNAFVFKDTTYGNRSLRGTVLSAAGAAPSLTTLIDDLQTVESLERAGGHWLAWTTDQPQQVLRMHTFESPFTQPALTLFSTPYDADEDLPPHAVGPTGLVSFSTAVDEDDAALWRVDPQTGFLELLTPAPVAIGPTLFIAPTGETVAGLGEDDDPTLFVAWPTDEPAIPSLSTAQAAFVLPGS